MAASLAETSSSHLPLALSGPKRSRKTITEMAPCFKPFGVEQVYAEGSVFELPPNKRDNAKELKDPSEVRVLAVLKKSPDQQRVTAINKILVMQDPEGDEVWVVPEQPGREDRAKRFRFKEGDGLEISLFNGSFLQVEYDLQTGVLRNFTGENHIQNIPDEIPKRDLGDVLQTMTKLVKGVPLELTTMQSLVNFPRDHKLEPF